MNTKNDYVRALWCAAKAAGGTLRLGPSVVEEFPGDDAFITISRDPVFRDLVISAHNNEASKER